MDKEMQVRERVRELRAYYTNLVIYVGIAIGCVLIWLLNGAGAFWPIWPIMAFGIAAVLQGVRLGQMKALEDWLPFLSPEWEDDQVKKMLKDTKDVKKVEIKKAKDKVSLKLEDMG